MNRTRAETGSAATEGTKRNGGEGRLKGVASGSPAPLRLEFIVREGEEGKTVTSSFGAAQAPMECKRFVGVDGCRGGWIAVELTAGGGWRTAVYPDAAALWAEHSEAELLLIDMPIGLSDRAEGRLCDRLARALLKPGRASSVFPAPARCVLGASGYAEANALQRERTGRGLSRQSWNLTGKIRELDALLQRDGAVRERMREAHPELCLARLFGEPMAHGKKTADGYRERVAHLSGVFPETDTLVERTLAAHRRSELARDDVVDALALAVSAHLSGGRLQRVPEAEERDGTGLLCAVWFYDRIGGRGG